MKYTIIFHGPFRIASGAASEGLDETYDAANPLPSSSLKGLMKAHAQHVLEIDDRLIAQVFGSAGGRYFPRGGNIPVAPAPSPWWWSDAVFPDSSPTGPTADRVRTRVRIDPVTFTSVGTALMTAGEYWPASATFEVRQRGPVPADQLARHEAILAASARAITALGSDRRRGLGWVAIQPELPWDDAQQELLVSCRRQHA
jgi:CRISPR/Cas system CSM-associated protein Csm3 (group 7 of RAMP superfamily)